MLISLFLENSSCTDVWFESEVQVHQCVSGGTAPAVCEWLCVVQGLPLLSPERGCPMQKVCTALLLDRLGRLLAASSDGCCYLLDAESLQQDARHILHTSQSGSPSFLSELQAVLWSQLHASGTAQNTLQVDGVGCIALPMISLTRMAQ